MKSINGRPHKPLDWAGAWRVGLTIARDSSLVVRPHLDLACRLIVYIIHLIYVPIENYLHIINFIIMIFFYNEQKKYWNYF